MLESHFFLDPLPVGTHGLDAQVQPIRDVAGGHALADQPEYLQFAGAIVLFLGILIGSYWFVYVPNRNNDERPEDRRG